MRRRLGSVGLREQVGVRLSYAGETFLASHLQCRLGVAIAAELFPIVRSFVQDHRLDGWWCNVLPSRTDYGEKDCKARDYHYLTFIAFGPQPKERSPRTHSTRREVSEIRPNKRDVCSSPFEPLAGSDIQKSMRYGKREGEATHPARVRRPYAALLRQWTYADLTARLKASLRWSGKSRSSSTRVALCRDSTRRALSMRSRSRSATATST